MPSTNPKLLFFITEDWYFWSHRLPLAKAAKNAGFTVHVAANDTGLGDRIRDEGLIFQPLPLNRSGKNPLRELSTLAYITRLYRGIRPDIVHHVALKPILYGAVAAKLAGTPRVVNAMAGLGHYFIAKDFKTAALGFGIKTALKLALRRRGAMTIFQNTDDLGRFVESGLVDRERTVIIQGSGVNTALFTPPDTEPDGTPLVVLPARMLWTKGVGEFVEAANIIKSRGIAVRMALVGDADPHNPACISPATLRQWHDSGAVEWWGGRDDMPEVFRQATVVALPSYREGLPKALIEAAAAGRALVSYDVPGCRSICRNEINGLLVPLKDAKALAAAIIRLLADPVLRRKMGEEGRRMAEREFSEEHVITATIGLYRELLADK